MSNNIQFHKWSAEDVAKWLGGLDMDDAIIPYAHFFLNNDVDGKKLLMLTHSDLDKLNVHKLGHQELILEAVDLLRNLKYGYETENLQSLALQLGCKARNLLGEIRVRSEENDRNKANVSHVESRSKQLSVGILSLVAELIGYLKTLVSWLDRSPFNGFHDLCLVRNTIVKLGLEVISMCQKPDITISDMEQNFSTSIRMLCDICEELVIGSPDRPQDPLFVQPASLELATIRKKPGEELGITIQSSYYGIHVISGIKDGSPADFCGKLEKGDEVIQVNYQTVVGWQLKKLVNLLKEKPKEVILLLKKRPRHISPFGHTQNKKKQMNKHAVQASTLPKSLKKMRSRDGEPKQRPSLQEFVVSTIQGDELLPPKDISDVTDAEGDTDNDVFRSGSESPQFTLPVQPDPKQRRATVSGGSPTLSRPLLVIEDLDTPTRPKSFTIDTRIVDLNIIPPPDGDLKNQTASQKRQEFKSTKSTPPSLEFTVKKITPRILEPRPDLDDKTPISEDSAYGSGVQEFVKTQVKEKKFLRKEDSLDDSVHEYQKHSLSPEHIHDSSTDSVPPSLESSIESSQTCTSSLESSSHSPSLDELSQSSEKEGPPETHAVKPYFPCTVPQTLESTRSFTPPLSRRITNNLATEDSSQAQLIKAQKISTTKITDQEAAELAAGLMEISAVEVDSHINKPEKKVTFGKLPTEKGKADKEASNQNLVHIVVGGVVVQVPESVTKSSPTESPVILRRPKTGKSSKKVDRRISCKDLGKGDCEGWLLKHRDKGGGRLSKKWKKRWFVLKHYDLFYYKQQEDQKAEGVIHLPAFQVSPVNASELRTKKDGDYAFKIHNAGTTFYLASDRPQDRSKWMNKLGLASITFRDKNPEPGVMQRPDPSRYKGTDASNEYFSESSDDEDVEVVPKKDDSQDDLTKLYRNLQDHDLSIDGKNRNEQRRRTLSQGGEDTLFSLGIDKIKKIKSLQRTLKAKEKELQELEDLMAKMTPEKLKQFKEHHLDHSTATHQKHV
ncbi:hypothetical protein CHS0354_032674 [Potamilus streckersoni]|uniref:Connector enhancer of kinase suppressor of ras 2 n=1 Tax=Potamilus streckersoni TaxID=2493646 RepID=A0AAE0TEZ0_9BIVA|nr:hypothetical protein CHS0354_032674 [Potamilus streckersoni]